jgi:hypothetical protein
LSVCDVTILLQKRSTAEPVIGKRHVTWDQCFQAWHDSWAHHPIVVILTLRNSIVQLVWFSLVLCSQKKPSAAFPGCNINLENYCVGKKIMDLWMSKMHTPEEFENLWGYGFENSEFSKYVHSINHLRIGRSLKNCRLSKNCRVSEMGTEKFTNCWIVDSRISEMRTRMWQSLNYALKNSKISKLQTQEYSRISELQTQGCKRISEL